MIPENTDAPLKADCPSAPCSASFECCGYPHPWSDKKCNREKGHGGEHACIEHYSGRQNEWWKGKDNE